MSQKLKLRITPSLEKHDYYSLEINDVKLGEYERSVYRHMIEIIDHTIGVGAESIDTEMTAEEYSEMLAKAKEAALSDNDEDCVMCGS
jgi:hypothetical protein